MNTATKWREVAKGLHALQNRAELYAGDLEAAGRPNGVPGVVGELADFTIVRAMFEIGQAIEALNIELRGPDVSPDPGPLGFGRIVRPHHDRG
jgi:hypothetical protein